MAAGVTAHGRLEGGHVRIAELLRCRVEQIHPRRSTWQFDGRLSSDGLFNVEAGAVQPYLRRPAGPPRGHGGKYGDSAVRDGAASWGQRSPAIAVRAGRHL